MREVLSADQHCCADAVKRLTQHRIFTPASALE